MKNIFLPLIFGAVSLTADAQITVSPAGSPSNIANLLTGSGVTISNVVVTGDTQAVAFFTASNSPLNMTGGFMLSTGICAQVAGPNQSTDITTAFGTTLNDPDLMSIEPALINDVAMIEFDCVPSDDTLFFNYLFGSEEYPIFVGSAFNDGFGLFVTGPNPAGGNYASLNVGLLGNGIPVSINNVNNGPQNNGPCVNCSYYSNNSNSAVLALNGTTTNLTAVVPVVPLSAYHLKIAVADAGDGILDSDVFLQAGSFRSGNALGVSEMSAEHFAVYPNPAKDELVLQFPETVSGALGLEILDAAGRIVQSENVMAGNKLVRCDISSLCGGAYLVRVTGESFASVRPLVVAK